VDVQSVLHNPLLTPEEHYVEGGVAGRWYHLKKTRPVLNRFHDCGRELLVGSQK
jgi:hypothetical protein